MYIYIYIKRTLQYQKLDVHRQIDALKKNQKLVQRQTYTIPLTLIQMGEKTKEKGNKKAEINQEY